MEAPPHLVLVQTDVAEAASSQPLPHFPRAAAAPGLPPQRRAHRGPLHPTPGPAATPHQPGNQGFSPSSLTSLPARLGAGPAGKSITRSPSLLTAEAQRVLEPRPQPHPAPGGGGPPFAPGPAPSDQAPAWQNSNPNQRRRNAPRKPWQGRLQIWRQSSDVTQAVLR